MSSDTKTRERTEGAATAVQAKHGDSCSSKRVQAGPTCSTNFGVEAEPPALPCRDDVLVENCAAVPKSCLSPLEMRTPTAGGDLLPTEKTFTATRITFHQLPLWFCLNEEINSRTSVKYASYYSSCFWRIINQSGRGSLKQNRGKIWCSMPVGRQVVSTPARFGERGARCFVGKFILRALDEAAAFFGGWVTWESSTCRSYTHTHTHTLQ